MFFLTYRLQLGLRLVRAIRNSSKAINNIEKEEIIKTIKSNEEITEKHSNSIHRGNYELVGYNTIESRTKYQTQIYNKENDTEDLENLRPFLLPLSLKGLFKLKLGEKIAIESDLPFPSFGHFAGYRIDDLKITIDKRTRDELRIFAKQYYQVEFDLEKKIIRFVNNINGNSRKTPIAGEGNYGLAA